MASRPSARRQARCGHDRAHVTPVSPATPGGWRGGTPDWVPYSPHLPEGHGDGGGDAHGGAGVGEVLQQDAVALQQHVGLARQRLGARRRPVRHRVAQLAAVRRHLRGHGGAQPGGGTQPASAPPPRPRAGTLSPAKGAGSTQ